MSDNFFKNLEQTMFNAAQATLKTIQNRSGKPISISKYLHFILRDDVVHPITKNSSDEDVKKTLAFLWWFAYTTKNIINENTGLKAGEGKLLQKLIDLDKKSKDPVGPQNIDGRTFGERQEAKPKVLFNGREFQEKTKKTKPKTANNFDILEQFATYVDKLEKNFSAISELYKVLTEIKQKSYEISSAKGVTEDDGLDAFFSHEKNSEYITDDGHINTDKLYNTLKSIEISTQELSKCAAFHYSLMSDEDGFNPSGLITTAIVDEAPDVSLTNRYVSKLIEDGKDTIDSMLGLSGLVQSQYDLYKAKIHSLLNPNPAPGKPENKDNGSDNSFIDMKVEQFRIAAHLMTSPIQSITDFYSKLARLWLFIKNDGIPEDLILNIKALMEMDDSSLLKKRFSLLFEAQETITNALKDKPLIWQNAFIFAQTMAYKINKTSYNTSEFSAKTSSGRTIEFTYPTDDIFQTIEDLKIKFAFMFLNTTHSGQPRMMNYSQTYKIPPDDTSRKNDLAIESGLNQNRKNKEKAEFKLKVSAPTFKKFIETVTKPDSGITPETKAFSYGEYLNKYKLNSNLVIKFDESATKTIVRFLVLDEKSNADPVQIEILTNPGTDRILKVLSLMNDYFKRGGTRGKETDIGIELDKLLTKEDKNIPPDGDFTPVLRKLVKGVLVFAKEALTGKYNYAYQPKNKMEEAIVQKTAEAIFGEGDTKIEKFLDCFLPMFEFDQTKPVNSYVLVEAIKSYCHSILFEFMTFDFSQYKSISDIKSQADYKETDADINEKFQTIRQHTVSNFNRRIGKSNIRTLDAYETLKSMAEGKEFGRVTNTLLRKTFGNKDIWISAKSAFNEIKSTVNRALSDKTDKHRNLINDIQNKVKLAFSKILNLSDNDKVAENDFSYVSLREDDFICVFDWEKDCFGMTQTYQKYMQIMAQNNAVPPDKAFKNARESENILKSLFKEVCDANYEEKDGTGKTIVYDYVTKLAFQYVILFYYMICLGEYLILSLNYGKIFDDGYVEMNKNTSAKKDKENTVGSQTQSLTRIPIDRNPIPGEIVIGKRNNDLLTSVSAKMDQPYEDEPEEIDPSTTEHAPF